MQQVVKVFYILLLFLCPGSILAFGLDQHAQITIPALQKYQICQQLFPDKLQEIKKRNELLVIASNRDIDRLSLLHLKRSFSRLWNWHFYDASLDDEINPHISIRDNFWGMHRSMHRTFVEKTIRIKQLGHTVDKDFYILSGEILHLIQDMGVPAHVIPIYHDSFKADKFDTYIAFEQVSNQLPGASKQDKKEDEKECQILMNENHSPEYLLKHLARDTRKAILGYREHPGGNNWTSYWNLSEGGKSHVREGFYTYGICGNTFSESVEEQSCQVEKEIFHMFYLQRYQKSLDASFRALLFLNRI